MSANDSTTLTSDTCLFEAGKTIRVLLDNIEQEKAKISQDTTSSKRSSLMKSLLTREPKAEVDDSVWDPVLDELKSMVAGGRISGVLLYEFDREMTVLKDQRHKENTDKVFKIFSTKDTTLNRILRLSPTVEVENYIDKNMPTYAASKKLYNIVQSTKLGDRSWRDFREEYAKLRKEKGNDGGYGLRESEAARRVFTIRHGVWEETILAKTVRIKPPLSAVTLLLKECRETLSFVDCPKWGWIPLQYAIKHQASPAVVSELIPTKDDMEKFSTFKQHDFLNEPDYNDRTVLHWAPYFQAQLETIKILRKSCSKEVLKKKDHCNHMPYETAIWHGCSTDIIEEFFEPGLDGHSNFESVLMKLVRSLTDKALPKSTGSSSIEEQQLKNESTHYERSKDDLPSIAARIAKSGRLQKEVEERLVKTLPTLIKTADIVMCALMLVSYQFCARNFLQRSSKSVWLYPLTIAASYITFREIADVYANNIAWFFSIWNYFDVVTICLLIYSLGCMLSGNRDVERYREFEALVVITTFFIWTNAITLLRSTFINIGTFVSGILKIVRELVPFLLVSLLVLVLFGEMFTLGALNSDECQQSSLSAPSLSPSSSPSSVPSTEEFTEFCTLADSLYTTYGLFIGGGTISIEKMNKNPLLVFLSVLFGLIIGIILLNVVIAIVSDSWNSAVMESKEIFWRSRMEFLRLFALPTNDSHLDKFLQGRDDWLSKICKPFWPSDDYWGVFDSFFDRMLNDDVGSFRWQITYEIAAKSDKKNSIKIILKAAFLLATFFIFACIWFVIGLISFGILWPLPIRRFILCRGSFIFSQPLETIEDHRSNETRDPAQTDILLTRLETLLDQIQPATKNETYQWN